MVCGSDVSGRYSSKIPSRTSADVFDYSKVDDVCQRIVDVFKPERIIIFGSVARGFPDGNSDIDMIVVMRTDLPYMKRPVAIYGSIDEFRMAADILVLTPEEYDSELKDEGSFISRISSDGVEIYAARVTRRLFRII